MFLSVKWSTSSLTLVRDSNLSISLTHTHFKNNNKVCLFLHTRNSINETNDLQEKQKFIKIPLNNVLKDWNKSADTLHTLQLSKRHIFL